jgi:DNA-binding transcriptional ArsR family regulator
MNRAVGTPDLPRVHGHADESIVSASLRFVETYLGEVQLEALGDLSRRTIVALLSSQGPSSVSVLASQLPISRPAVSQHLRILKAARLVSGQADGTRRIYALDTAGLRDLRAYFSRFWREDLDGFADFVHQEISPEDGR